MGFSTTENVLIDNDRSAETTSNEYSDDDPDVINIGQCYCGGECTPSGLINVTSCRYGAPVFVSLPHFYKADPLLLNQIEGLMPNGKDHAFSITLEPVSDKLANRFLERERQICRDRNNSGQSTLCVTAKILIILSPFIRPIEHGGCGTAAVTRAIEKAIALYYSHSSVLHNNST